MDRQIIAIIPARGGSKGVPKKNIRSLAGKPLIYYTIRAAQNSGYINRTIVSTDSDEILDIASAEGALVVKRPAELSGDDAPTVDAILHVLHHCSTRGLRPEIVVVLQPTSPFRTSLDIDAALELFLRSDCESVISVCEVTHPPQWNMVIERSYLQPLFDRKTLTLRRQDLPKTYLPNGAIYIASAGTLRRVRSFYCQKTKPYVMSAERSLDIDSEFDFLFAEAVMNLGVDKLLSQQKLHKNE